MARGNLFYLWMERPKQVLIARAPEHYLVRTARTTVHE